MMTEFEVRGRVAAIQNSNLSPMRKARMLLRIGRSLDLQEAALRRQTRQLTLGEDRNARSALARMADHTHHLHCDILDEAMVLIRGEGGIYLS